MAEIRPFKGIRPRKDLARRVIAPPYDTVSRSEARAICKREPLSFLHVTRPDADLPDDVDVHSAQAYQAARAAFDHMVEDGTLVQDDRPCFYLYSQTWRNRTQVGLMALCSVDEYDRGVIKKHELTRPDKEQDRVDHIEALDAQTGLVFLAWHDRDPKVREAMHAAGKAPLAWAAQTEDGVEHAFQVVSDPELVATLQAAFAEVPVLYIADGHHRSAAASRVAAARGGAGTSGWFLAGIFPDSHLQVMAYNRLVRDLNGLDVDAFCEKLREHFIVGAAPDPIPEGRGRFTMYLGGHWFQLTPREGVVPEGDPVGSLDVAVLQDRVLGPILGIENPRTDDRIEFVGGIRGHNALEGAVDRGDAAVAFHLYPTGLDQLFAVADADRLMPPKSTWFEPKLRGGVVVHKID